MNFNNGLQIDARIITDDKVNYSMINAQKQTILRVKLLKEQGEKITYFPHFVMINGETYNIDPEMVRKL